METVAEYLFVIVWLFLNMLCGFQPLSILSLKDEGETCLFLVSVIREHDHSEHIQIWLVHKLLHDNGLSIELVWLEILHDFRLNFLVKLFVWRLIFVKNEFQRLALTVWTLSILWTHTTTVVYWPSADRQEVFRLCICILTHCNVNDLIVLFKGVNHVAEISFIRNFLSNYSGSLIPNIVDLLQCIWLVSFQQ